MLPGIRTDQSDALREFLRQNEMAGTSRRALLLHADRFPPALAKPHHLRLAREALDSLVSADRAQSFELSRGRIAIIWRDRGGDELTRALTALGHLLAGQPQGEAPRLGELVTLYDLPDQGVWLFDELCDDAGPHPASAGPPLDLAALAALETTLAHADLSPFARWRPVMRLRAAGPPAASLARIETEPVWEELYFASYALEASLSPSHALKADPWLFARLTRVLDRRMLAMLGNPGELRAHRTLAITLNIATILGADFLRFDDIVPAHLRGEAILKIRPADLLASPGDFLFARGFAHARGYRLALAGASLPLLQIMDLQEAGFDYIMVKLGADKAGAPGNLTSLFAPGTKLVAMGLDRASDVRTAVSAGITLGMGRALSH